MQVEQLLLVGCALYNMCLHFQHLYLDVSVQISYKREGNRIIFFPRNVRGAHFVSYQ
jgi:hypothetical protein